MKVNANGQPMAKNTSIRFTKPPKPNVDCARKHLHVSTNFKSCGFEPRTCHPTRSNGLTMGRPRKNTALCWCAFPANTTSDLPDRQAHLIQSSFARGIRGPRKQEL